MKNSIIKQLALATFCSFTLMLSGCLKEDTNPAEGTPNSEVSLYVLKNLFKDENIQISRDKLSGAYITGGVVVSHHENNNLPQGLIALESVWRGQIRGLFVQVQNTGNYSFGDSLSIDIEGTYLSDINGSLVLTGLAPDQISVVSSGHQKTHRPVSIQALQNNYSQFEATLVSVTADVEPEPATGTTLEGVKTLQDGEGNGLILFTDGAANFAQNILAPSATFQGIALRSGSDVNLRMQNGGDMAYPSGRIYPGWPETYEEPSHPKGSYNMTDINNNVGFSTGEWHLYQSIIGNTAGRDRIVSGTNAIRFQQNRSDDEYLQMNFDVPNGASKVTFWYGSYYTDRSCTFQLEYSLDQGTTWSTIGNPISDAHPTSESLIAKQAVFLMDIDVPVRFRINKLGLGTSNNSISNGRLGVDDFAIYQSY